MKLKVEMCAKRDFIKKYVNIDEEYVWAEIKGGGYTKFNIKVIDQTTLSRQDYFMKCTFIVETCLFDSCICNIEMYYADGQIFLQELTESEGVTPASMAFYAFPIKEKKEESQPEEEKRIHNIFAITSKKNTYASFNKITLAPAIESIYDYTVCEKNYMNEKELDNAWIIYSMCTKPLFINGHSYDTKTVAFEKHEFPYQDIIFVKDNFNIVMDILKDLKERATIDIHSSYPTGSMIKEDKSEYKDSYYLTLLDPEVDEYIKHFEPESIDFIELKRKEDNTKSYFTVKKVAQAWRHIWFKISFETPEIAEKYVQKNKVITFTAFTIDAVNLKYNKVITRTVRTECPYNTKETKENENMSTVMVDSKEYSETYRLANLYKKEHEAKNLLKNTGISIEFKPGKISYNPDIKDIKFNGPATIVFWNDGSKTVVKKGSGETTDDRKKAIIMAFLKKNKEDYKIIENTFNSEDPELALAISLLKRKGYSKDMLNKIYNKYKPKEEVKPKRKNIGKKEKANGGSVKKRNKKS